MGRLWADAIPGAAPESASGSATRIPTRERMLGARVRDRTIRTRPNRDSVDAMTEPIGASANGPTGLWQAEPGPMPKPPLPGMLLAAGIVLLVAGTLAGILGAIFLFTGLVYDQLPNTPGSGMTDAEFRATMGAAKILVIVLGIGGLVVAGAHMAAGVGIIRRADWARIVGMVVAVLAILVSLLFLLLIVVAGTQPPGSLSGAGLTEVELEQLRAAAGIGLVFAVGLFGTALLAYGFVLVALIRRGSAFR